MSILLLMCLSSQPQIVNGDWRSIESEFSFPYMSSDSIHTLVISNQIINNITFSSSDNIFMTIDLEHGLYIGYVHNFISGFVTWLI